MTFLQQLGWLLIGAGIGIALGGAAIHTFTTWDSRRAFGKRRGNL